MAQAEFTGAVAFVGQVDLSFTGVVTYKNARKSLEVIEWLPMDRIMIETDSPYLAASCRSSSTDASENSPQSEGWKPTAAYT